MLKPGGWIEHTEDSLPVTRELGTISDTYLHGIWTQLFTEAGEKTSKTFDPNDTNKSAMEATGFTNIQTKARKMPIGAWPIGPNMKKVGVCNQECYQACLEGVGRRVLSQVFSWREEEIEVFLAKTREMRKKRRLCVFSVW